MTWTQTVIMKPLALTLSLVGATSAAAETPNIGGTAIIVTSDEPAVLNAVISASPPDATVGCIIYEGLVINRDGTNEAEPGLAESWSVSADGMTHTFNLRKTNWHDGTPFTADDVVYTLNEVASRYNPTFSAQIAPILKSVTAPDPRTVVITLSEPYGPLLLALSCGVSGGILPKHIFDIDDV